MTRLHLLNWLITWLNQEDGENEQERRKVRGFLGLMQDAQRLALEIDALPDTVSPHHSAFERQFQLHRKINGFLRSYPVVHNVRLYPPRLFCDLWLVEGNKQQVQEFGFIKIILETAQRQPITDIRECNCGKLFLARSTLTRFCSPGCRIAYWENSDERKQRKRDKAREYYLLHKTGIVKSASKAKASSTQKKGR
jgi:hypothetical protein